MLFFYVRHGAPTYTPDQLTPLGRRQAEAVGKRLALFGIDKIYSSTSTRAQQTADPTCEMLGKEKILLDFCHETHAWREMTRDIGNNKRRWLFEDPEIKRLFVSDEIRRLGYRWYEHPAFSDCDYRSGMERISRGTDELLASLGYELDHDLHMYRAVKPTEERVALFAHQGFGSLFLSCLLDIPYPEFSTHYDLQHTGVTVIEFRDEDGYVIPRILTMGNDAHLYREGLPLKYNSRHVF
jgi:probable phosphoglycerate mutase